MKSLFIFIYIGISLLSFASVSAQVQDSVYCIVDEMPQYKGGSDALDRYLSENLRYPEAGKNLGLRAKVYVRFVVDELGHMNQCEVLRTTYNPSPGKSDTDEQRIENLLPLMEKEALRLISEMPPWKPGLKDGKEVKVATIVSLAFVPNN